SMPDIDIDFDDDGRSEVLKCADYIIELGPDAGASGGEIIAAGTPDDIARNPRSVTGKYLRLP
ncbi:MAG: hypothetical protein ACFNUT_05000, partial [Bacteroidota bacterium]